jgi:hypothetical protein
MKDFKLNDKDYQMPTDWQDMNLRKYVELAKLEEMKESFGMPELYLLKVIEALCDAEGGDLDDLTLDMVSELANEVGFLQAEPVWSNTRHIEIEGKDYVFPEDLNRLTMGEYISIKTLQEQQTTQADLIPWLLAIILRPGRKEYNEETKKEKWIQDKFNTANLEWRKELFMNQPVMNLMGPVTFFLNGNGTFMNSIKDSIPEVKNQAL